MSFPLQTAQLLFVLLYAMPMPSHLLMQVRPHGCPAHSVCSAICHSLLTAHFNNPRTRLPYRRFQLLPWQAFFVALPLLLTGTTTVRTPPSHRCRPRVAVPPSRVSPDPVTGYSILALKLGAQHRLVKFSELSVPRVLPSFNQCHTRSPSYLPATAPRIPSQH